MSLVSTLEQPGVFNTKALEVAVFVSCRDRLMSSVVLQDSFCVGGRVLCMVMDAEAMHDVSERSKSIVHESDIFVGDACDC